MPTYDYVCEKCGHEFARIESMEQHERKPHPCPKCKSKRVTRVFSGFFAKTVKKS